MITELYIDKFSPWCETLCGVLSHGSHSTRQGLFVYEVL
jgi:hypothetical protein